jgi:uncharacterized protein YdeI (YjbR/CyaY-like superfamily)
MELYFRTRVEWRKWLDENHSKEQGIWLIYYKKLSGKPSISYNDAVEEALCFGWIDGKIKRVNDDYYIQWFTHRRPGSKWSNLNIGRAEKLINEGIMRPEGLLVYEVAGIKPQLTNDIRTRTNILVPDDLMNALKKNSEAYNNFINFPPSGRRLYILWLNNAKREETRLKRIAKIVGFSEKNIRAGMM